MIVKDIRQNSDIKKIVLHHSTHIAERTGAAMNKGYISTGQFGLPYDILINTDGTVDLSSRWFYGSNSVQFLKNVSITSITTYSNHYLSVMGDTPDMNKNAVHIALAGNFDVNKPALQQLNSLVKVLNQLIQFYQIDPRIYFYYHNELSRRSCPGVNMMPKQQLIGMLTLRLFPDFIIQKAGVDVVIDPTILNFTGSKVAVTIDNDTVNINYSL